MARARHYPSFQPKILQIHQAGVHYRFPKKLERIAELGSICILQPYTLPIHRAQVRLKIYEETPSHAPSSFTFHLPTNGSSILPIQGTSENFQPKTPLHLPTRTHLEKFPVNLHALSLAHTQFPSKQTSIIFAQPHFFFKLYPNISPSKHPSYHPYKSPTITPFTRPTSTPSHLWAIPGRFGRPHGSHCTRIQGYISIPGLFPDVVMYRVVHSRGVKKIF